MIASVTLLWLGDPDPSGGGGGGDDHVVHGPYSRILLTIARTVKACGLYMLKIKPWDTAL